MNLLAKEYFSLQEISNIWAVSRDDLLYYGENNILEISVRPAAIVAGIEKVCCNTEFTDYLAEGKRQHFSPQPLLPTDIYRIMKAGTDAVPVYHTKYRFHEKISDIIENKGIMLSYTDLVVTRAEKHCFEINNGMCLNGRQIDIFRHSGDFREVYYDNRRYQFGVIQARIIALLYAASRTEMPWVYGKDLLNKAGSESLRVAALFRGNIGWQELVFSDRRGYYRLRLPLRHIVPVQSQLQLQFAV